MTAHAEDALRCPRVSQVLNLPLAVATPKAARAEGLIAGQYSQILNLVTACVAAVSTIVAYEGAVAEEEEVGVGVEESSAGVTAEAIDTGKKERVRGCPAHMHAWLLYILPSLPGQLERFAVYWLAVMFRVLLDRIAHTLPRVSSIKLAASSAWPYRTLIHTSPQPLQGKTASPSSSSKARGPSIIMAAILHLCPITTLRFYSTGGGYVCRRCVPSPTRGRLDPVTAQNAMEELPAPQIDGFLADDTLQLSAPPFSRVDSHRYLSPSDAHSSRQSVLLPHTHDKTERGR